MHVYLARSLSSGVCMLSLYRHTIITITIAIAHLLSVRYSQIRGLSIVISQWLRSSYVVVPSALVYHKHTSASEIASL